MVTKLDQILAILSAQVADNKGYTANNIASLDVPKTTATMTATNQTIALNALAGMKMTVDGHVHFVASNTAVVGASAVAITFTDALVAGDIGKSLVLTTTLFGNDKYSANFVEDDKIAMPTKAQITTKAFLITITSDTYSDLETLRDRMVKYVPTPAENGYRQATSTYPYFIDLHEISPYKGVGANYAMKFKLEAYWRVQ